MQRVLETMARPIPLARPLWLFFRTEDPAPVVFGLDDEDAEGRNHHVVDLGGALAIRSVEVKIAKGAVKPGVETPKAKVAHHELTEPAFERCSAEDLEKEP